MITRELSNSYKELSKRASFFGKIIAKRCRFNFTKPSMKKLFALLMFAGSIAVSAQPATTDLNWTPTAKFAKSEHDFGTVAENGKIYTEFSFTNTGKEPIFVKDATAGCGCTTPEWTTAPVLPGKSSSVKVGYNTDGRPGSFSKEVTVNFYSGVNKDNTGSMKLLIKGNVTAKAEQATKTTETVEPAKAPLNTTSPSKKATTKKASPSKVSSKGSKQ